MLPLKVRKQLPKAALLRVEVGGYYDKPYVAKFRMANAIRWQLWRVCITHRMPWLERSARFLHPELFKDRTNDQ